MDGWLCEKWNRILFDHDLRNEHQILHGFNEAVIYDRISLYIVWQMAGKEVPVHGDEKLLRPPYMKVSNLVGTRGWGEVNKNWVSVVVLLLCPPKYRVEL